MNTADIMAALQDRFAPPSWALLEQVADKTGAYVRHFADAIAVGLWPSRGLDIIGIEVKASRSDWLRELKNPAKADTMVERCDSWWVAAGEKGIVLPGELPGGWGLLEPHGTKLRASVVAHRKASHPELARPFVISILRRAWEASPSVTLIEKAKKAAYQQGHDAGKADATYSARHQADALARLQKAVGDFETASGVKIDSYADGARLGEAVKLVRACDVDAAGRMEQIARNLTELAGTLRAIHDGANACR